jgi:hypothetical protein
VCVCVCVCVPPLKALVLAFESVEDVPRLIKSILRHEILCTKHVSTLFRGNSLASKIMTGMVVKMFSSKSSPLRRFCARESGCECDVHFFFFFFCHSLSFIHWLCSHTYITPVAHANAIGEKYLKTLIPELIAVIEADGGCEVNPVKLQDGEDMSVHQAKLFTFLGKFLVNVTESVEQIPLYVVVREREREREKERVRE